MKEKKILEWLQKNVKAQGADLVAGIGDDTAAIKPLKNAYLLLTTDAVVDGVHFEQGKTAPAAIGRKALAVNLSDIAAMGGVPLFALVSLGLPAGDMRLVSGLYRGLLATAQKHGVRIIGGNLSKSPVLFLDVFLAGRVEKKHLKLRNGAGPGDIIFVTGTLGGASAGKHLAFEPRLKEGREIAALPGVTAMMDVSDGLSSDLSRLAEASGTGFALDLQRIPVSAAAKKNSRTQEESLSRALNEGEDYELLFTVTAKSAARVPAKLGETPVTRIGTMTREKKFTAVRLNKTVAIPAKGFDHFNKRKTA